MELRVAPIGPSVAGSLLAYAAMLPSGTATTLHVPSEFATIQSAIDAATHGDTALVHPGTYVETLDFLGKEIVVSGTAPSDSIVVAGTVVDAGGAGSVVRFDSGEGPDALITGLTLTGGSGTALGGEGSYAGGGIYCFESSPTVRRCVVSENEAWCGGGICLWRSNATIDSCTIIGNWGTGLDTASGGGIACVDSCAPLIEESLIVGNNNNNGFGGGVAVLWGASPLLRGCEIRDNRTSGNNFVGGGIGFFESEGALLDRCRIEQNAISPHSYTRGLGIGGLLSTALIRDSEIVNHRDYWAAALYWKGSYLAIESCRIADNRHGIWCDESIVEVTDTRIEDNTFTHGRAAGIDATDSILHLSRCTIRRNFPYYSESKGGGISLSGGELHVIDSDIRDNGSYYGGGAHVQGAELVRMTRCQVTGNGAVAGGGFSLSEVATVVIEDCAFRDNRAIGYYGGAGGAIWIDSSRTIDLDRCTLEHNEAALRGGGASLRGTDVRVHGCRFVDNRTVGTHWNPGQSGGGLQVEGGRVSLESCVFAGNEADLAGGGVSGFADTLVVANCEVRNNTLVNNDTNVMGGGLYLVAADSLYIAKSVVSGNSSANYGGGVYASAPFVLIKHSSVVDNDVRGVGTGYYGGGGLCITGERVVAIRNSTVLRNRAGAGGGITSFANETRIENSAISGNISLDDDTAAVYGVGWDNSFQVRNTIVWGNTGAQIAGWNPDGIHIRYSNIEAGWPGEGNIDEDPRFRARGAYEALLAPGSRCIDSGDPELEDGVSDDHRLWPDRYRNAARSDMGAYGGPWNYGWLPPLAPAESRVTR